MQEKDALLIVDVQNDFCPGGALPVLEGDHVVSLLNECIRKFQMANLWTFATRDWHPEKTRHFNIFGGTWPPHCVKGTHGASFHSALELSQHTVVISKGINSEDDCYSGFEGTDSKGIKLADILHELAIKRLFIGGLATDYCVKFTVLDAIKEGFEVILLRDAIRGVNLQAGDAERSISEMIDAGAVEKKSFEI